MPDRRLTLYRRRTCALGPPPFDGPSLTLPTGRAGAYKVTVQIAVDDAVLTVEVDTGANRTLVDAGALGLSHDALAPDRPIRLVTADPVGQMAHLHRFRRLQVGSDGIARPVLVVGRVQGQGFSGLLGSDYWRTRRLWISDGGQTVKNGLPRPAIAGPPG